MMIYEKELKGKYVTLRSIQETDAEVVLKMRLNPQKTKYMGAPIENDINHERNWIKQIREKKDDYTFVSVDSFGNVIGKIGIYNFKDNCAESGRLLMYGNALQSIESVYLALKFDFEVLNLDRIWSSVDPENKSSLKLSKMFGEQFNDPEYFEPQGRIMQVGILAKQAFYLKEKEILRILRY